MGKTREDGVVRSKLINRLNRRKAENCTGSCSHVATFAPEPTPFTFVSPFHAERSRPSKASTAWMCGRIALRSRMAVRLSSDGISVKTILRNFLPNGVFAASSTIRSAPCRRTQRRKASNLSGRSLPRRKNHLRKRPNVFSRGICLRAWTRCRRDRGATHIYFSNSNKIADLVDVALG